MPPDVEACADDALVAVLTQDGEVCGTGFVIDGNGTVLTCHHVVDGLASVRLRGSDGSTQIAGSEAFVFAPEIDLALIRTAEPLGNPLPLVSEPAAMPEYWTKGFHRLGEGIRAAFPVQGRIIGRTSVSYHSGTASYDIDDVFVLRDDAIDPGLSGAPVLDPNAGVVVAVVSTKLVRKNDQAGFAVPIGHAVTHSGTHPELARAVARNQDVIPAYGPYLNAPAARALCAAVTDSEIENLQQFRHVSLNRRVARVEIEDATARFLATDAPVFALIGPSGVGKSTEVAALARRLPGRALLLRGSSLRPDSAGVGEAVEAALSSASGGLLLPDAADRAIAGALAEDAGLIVLLDALNEAPLSGQEFEDWIARSRSWLRRTPARLVVSCRSELWGDVVGRSLSAAIDHREPIVVSLGGFTSREYSDAARSCGLSSGIDWPILHLPLALGLYASLEERPAADTGADASVNQVIEAYVEEAARRLVRTQSGPPQSAQIMRGRLVEAAARMRERDTDVLGMQAFSEIFGSTTIADSLVLEGVMSWTPKGCRFTYDDVSDWLQAQRLDLDGELAAMVHDKNRSWRHVTPIASALRDVGHRVGVEALRSRLMQVINDAGTAHSLALRVTENTLVKMADAQPYTAVLDRMIDLTIRSPETFDLSIGFWRSVPVPLPTQIGLLRRLIPLDSDYPLRPKDWAIWRGPGPGWGSDSTYSMLVYHLVEREPAAGIPALLPWLDDVTPLSGGEATIAHVAMWIFYRLRRQEERHVWSAVTKASGQCHTLIYRLAQNDPQWLARMVSGEHSAEADDELLISAAAQILGRSSIGPERALLPEETAETVRRAVADRYARGLAPELQGRALALLAQGENGQLYFGPLIQAYRDGVPGVDAWTLEPVAHNAADIVLPALAEALEGQGERRETALQALGYSDDARVQAASDRAVRHYLETGLGVVDHDLCWYVRNRLYRSEVLGEDLLAVTRRIIAAPPGSGRKALADPLTSRTRLDQAQHVTLLREFLDAPGDPEAVKEAAEGLIATIIGRNADFLGLPPMSDALVSDAFALLRQALAHLDSSKADEVLFYAALRHRGEGFPDLLARWLTNGQLPPPGKYMRKLKAQVEAGEDPQSAVRQI
jgi:hypothetical protein